MYPATCSNCGRSTEVPFLPRNEKPVYCRECFQERRGSQQRYSSY
jgi:CxxC-x17-CxxC domain-containing protein